MRDSRHLEGHLAIITGACGGIGEAFARELAKRQCGLLLIDINKEGLSRLAARLANEVKVHTLDIDLTAEGAAGIIFNYCDSENLNPDILVNNAGIFNFMEVADMSEKRIDLFIRLHISAVTLLSRRFALFRRERGSGWILNMSSMSCWMPMPGIALYAATKAYIRVFTRALHYEMKDSGIKVMAACPGGIATSLFGLPPRLMKLAVGIGALARPETFARKALNRLFKGRRQYINGLINRISILAVGIAPTWMRMMVKHRMLDKGIVR